MEATDLTVIISTSGQPDLLPLALAHLEGQTHPAARFEVVVSEFGRQNSPAHSRTVVDRYIAGAPMRVQYIPARHANRAQACNSAIDAARGRYLLFLEDDLLAAPALVESHLRAHAKNHGVAAVIGRVDFHPQLDPRTITRWQTRRKGRPVRDGERVGCHNWRLSNLSLPADAVEKSGRFSEDAAICGMEDIELAYRLAHEGLSGYFAIDACAFVWRGTSLNHERCRNYTEGYALYELVARVNQEDARRIFLAGYSRPRVAASALTARLCALACPQLAPNTPLHTLMRKHLEKCDRFRGYRDASRGAPRLTPPPEPAYSELGVGQPAIK